MTFSMSGRRLKHETGSTENKKCSILNAEVLTYAVLIAELEKLSQSLDVEGPLRGMREEKGSTSFI